MGEDMAWLRIPFTLCLVTSFVLSSLALADHPETWDLDPANRASLSLDPVREDALSRDNLHLALKHFSHPGAQPVLLIHGLAQNDRAWDSPIKRYSFARFLHAQGFDVWVGNMRAAGTPGFRSETPRGPHHWTIDDYAINDVPALIESVQRSTGQAPFVVGHSLAAWALEGYLAGITYDRDGSVISRAQLANDRQTQIRGIATIAGVYNLRWEHPLSEATSRPIFNADDYYHSNYELELLAKIRPLFRVVPDVAALPLDWVSTILNFPLENIPFIGGELRDLYRGFQSSVIGTPILSMLYYAPDSDHEMVRLHAQDGLEDLGPRLLEQLGNCLHDQRTSSYYHLDRPSRAYDYGRVRQARVDVPLLFVGGGRDRLASDLEIYQDGFEPSQARDKQYLHVENFGHLDILTGVDAPREVMAPVASWIRSRM
jgi:pimeloyl-ACP methyl ester carboxylesterase